MTFLDFLKTPIMLIWSMLKTLFLAVFSKAINKLEVIKIKNIHIDRIE